MARFGIILSVCAAVVGGVVDPVSAAINIVASAGDASPDGNGTLSQFYPPTINAAGQVAFVSNLVGTSGGTADNQAMYRRDPGGLVLITRSGASFLGGTNVLFFTVAAHLDSSGNAAGTLFVNPPNALRYFLGNGGPLSPVAAPGSASPSGNNSLLGMTTVGVNDAGLAIYRAVYTGANVESGLYTRAANGSVTTRLKNGTAVPRGGTINSAGGRPALNESGQIGTVMIIDNGAGTFIESATRIDGSTPHELIREGDMMADGITTISEIRSESALINESGKVTFVADYNQPTSIGQGVFLADTSGVTMIAPGLLPGGGSGTNNVQVFGISDSGRVALSTEFVAGIDPLSGIYIADTSGQTIVAFEDTATPVPGKYFRAFHNDWASMNGAGQIAFLADLSDTANGAAAGKGLYFYDPATGLKQIARTGDSLGGSTITDLFFSGTVPGTQTQSPDTSLSGLSSMGRVAFAFRLANADDGIAVWSSSIPGDYNQDGAVDAADYTVWRDRLGTSSLPNETVSPGIVDLADYNEWKNHFGQSGSGSGNNSSFSDNQPVPEPSSMLLALAALLPALRSLRRPLAQDCAF